MPSKGTIPRTCLICDQTFLVRPYRVCRDGANFCSQACRRKGQAAGLFSKQALIERFLSNIDRRGECWIWTGSVSKDGYGQLSLMSLIGSRSMQAAHRIAWRLATGEDPGRYGVLHTCDVRLCVRNDDIGTYEVDGRIFERRGHLFLGDRRANNVDAGEKGRMPRGEKHWNSKLTTADVIEIRRLYAAEGIAKTELARRYGVDRALIHRILAHKIWTHVA